ncbi:Histone deacetylase 11 [Nibea albiflora]|uniref:Histone deacetylase 11 n=1 Tax=Nibea albiflora TaxID=240163 RepID=A0ACB7F2U4_NIBAL|nr:Histone deacetylase 11 [Nibea albiflora]
MVPLEVALLLRLKPAESETSAVVTLLDWFDLSDVLILVLERPDPCIDLFDYIHSGKDPMKEHKAKIITRQLMDALIEMHSKGVFHGDIKTDNILIETGSDVPRVRIIDFGCGTFLSDATRMERRVFLCSPPERWRNSTMLPEPTTVWQLGLVLFEMLHRCLPFQSGFAIMNTDVILNNSLSNGHGMIHQLCMQMQTHEKCLHQKKRDCYSECFHDHRHSNSSHRTELYTNIPRTCMPIVYHPDYNITFMGLEKLHPFDAGKWGKVIRFLKEEEFITDGNIVEAHEATEEDLLVVHTKRYLNRLKWSLVVATITEIPPLLFLPNFLVQRKVLRPLRTQTGGTIMFLFERVEGISRATIIDLDAHQGNGHERDFLDDRRVFIMDMYNRYIYPGDGYAKRAIKRKVELDWGTEDSEYLQKVELHSEGALNEVRPDIIIYNAGTDILDGDPLGGLSISPQGIIKRDEIVFRAARQRGVPILMVTSGGYQKKTARIIADSILNLHRQGLIGGEALEGEGSSSLVTSMMCPSGSAGSKFTAV